MAYSSTVVVTRTEAQMPNRPAPTFLHGAAPAFGATGVSGAPPVRQTRSVASQLPLAHRSPAGLAARLSTASVWPRGGGPPAPPRGGGPPAPRPPPPAAPAPRCRPRLPQRPARSTAGVTLSQVEARDAHCRQRLARCPAAQLTTDTENKPKQCPNTMVVKDDHSAGVPEQVVAHVGQARRALQQ